MSGALAALLAPFAWAYGGAMRARRALYARGVLRSRRLGVPVISVGNLSLGGTGKTPFAAWLALGLQQRGLRVAIVLRGYGRETRGVRVVSDGRGITGEARSVGDEALLLARDLPGVVVVIGESRHRAGCVAVAELGAEVVILDDGFQHLALHRDLDVVLVDGFQWSQSARVLPAGRLRENPAALAAADIVVISRSHLVNADSPLVDWLGAVAPEASVHAIETRPRRLVDGQGVTRDLESLRGTPVVALSAIGAPAQFEADLLNLGATLAATLRFRDHHRFDAGDLRHIEETHRACGAALVVTTAKDLVRLDRPLEVPVFALEIDVEVREPVAFWRRLARVIPALGGKA